MEITIIGTGNMARGIATRALAGGHTVALLGTEVGKAQGLAAELSGEVHAGGVGDPLAGDVVVLAIWYPDAVRTAFLSATAKRSCSAQPSGKTLFGPAGS